MCGCLCVCVCLYLRLARHKKIHLSAAHVIFSSLLKLCRTINVDCCWLALVHVCVCAFVLCVHSNASRIRPHTISLTENALGGLKCP